jgi:hypothetical protein
MLHIHEHMHKRCAFYFLKQYTVKH